MQQHICACCRQPLAHRTQAWGTHTYTHIHTHTHTHMGIQAWGASMSVSAGQLHYLGRWLWSCYDTSSLALLPNCCVYQSSRIQAGARTQSVSTPEVLPSLSLSLSLLTHIFRLLHLFIMFASSCCQRKSNRHTHSGPWFLLSHWVISLLCKHTGMTHLNMFACLLACLLIAGPCSRMRGVLRVSLLTPMCTYP
jgi:hypothetical protein